MKMTFIIMAILRDLRKKTKVFGQIWKMISLNCEELFTFEDIEAVLDGDRIPFFGGTTKRISKT